MKLTFLEAAGGVRLSKTVTPTETKSYPNVKLVTSHEVDVAKGDIKAFEQALRTYAAKGFCLMKGPVRRPLEKESRKGMTDNIAYADYIVVDIDNANLPGFRVPKEITAEHVRLAAEQIVAMLPIEFSSVSYIAQASSSLGFKQDRVSMHLYFMLKAPLPSKTIKLWLRYINVAIAAFNHQLDLTASGSSLRYVIDPSVADNSKLIFIAPPSFSEKGLDPFVSPDDRIVRVDRAETMIDLTKMLNSVHPEALTETINEKKDQLRLLRGLPKKKPKLTIVSHGDQQVEVLMNPDRVTISVVDETNYPYVRCNINGGDSNAYWFNVEDATYMFNFKDEPAFEIQKADPEFAATLIERYADRGAKGKIPLRPVVMRDFYTDTCWNGVFDPNINQFTDEFPLTPTSVGSTESFMRSHGRAPPSFIPDAKVTFDPSKIDDEIQLENTPYYVNMYRRSPYMIDAIEPGLKLAYGSANTVKTACPTIYKIMFHMLGSSLPEVEHFMNWLAFIYQNKNKTMTAWVLTGVPGTGKGLFVNKVLKPLFGNLHVPMRSMENIEEQFNMYMRSALILVVDEFRMMDARLGTTRIADKLKSMITEPTLTIRGMRANQIELPSYANYIFLTNRPDAVKIEDGDRRYNVAPRQDRKLVDVYPSIINDLPKIEAELFHFAGALASMEVDAYMARTCLSNMAKKTMREVSMSVKEEFVDAFKRGDLVYFTDILDISITNTFEAGMITSAQRTVREWLLDAVCERESITTAEELRLVYLTFAQPTPPPSPREFAKVCARAGLETQRKRGRRKHAVRGYITSWVTPKAELDALGQDYLEESDFKHSETG